MSIKPTNSTIRILDVLSGKKVVPAPVWLMRQAGRYLPEYRELRSRIGSFWEMCMTPKVAAEITLQPIRRFGFDAAIIFSDILVIPFALGQKVRFEDGRGPTLERLDLVRMERETSRWAKQLQPVYETVSLVRQQLSPKLPVIGFAGAPWTLLAYMLGGTDVAPHKVLAQDKLQEISSVLSLLIDAVAFHLCAQLEAGAEVVQLFDSHAGLLNEERFSTYVVEPTRKIVDLVRARYPAAKIIGFPRGASKEGYLSYARNTGVNAISLDQNTSMIWAVDQLSPFVILQGNLDPNALVTGGDLLDHSVDEILAATRGVPLIFNLGHGVLPDTPVGNVERMVQHVRGWL